jgi:hypothetical protein
MFCLNERWLLVSEPAEKIDFGSELPEDELLPGATGTLGVDCEIHHLYI